MATAEAYQGQTIRVTASIVDEDDAAYTPDQYVKCQIKDSGGTLILEADTMTTIAVGSFDIEVDIPTTAAVGRAWIGVIGNDGAVAQDKCYGALPLIIKKREWEA